MYLFEPARCFGASLKQEKQQPRLPRMRLGAHEDAAVRPEQANLDEMHDAFL